ncbi:MAG: 4Fe-4S binding protein [Puniceicoccales bacterium]|jgi:[FeFe] hydrogenase (group B1/B3)|nr:4Fe-4S binding protein [Puniceicoccales bacterium]
MTPGFKTQRRAVLIRVIRAFNGQNFVAEIEQIPQNLPLEGEKSYSVPDDVRRALVATALGFAADEKNIDLAHLARLALERTQAGMPPLTTIPCACNGCSGGRIRVTDLCQSCALKPCMQSCKFDAISNDGNRTSIDGTKCKKCAACLRTCPYGAIAKTIMPCENVCPVAAISRDAGGRATIDFSKCICCGKCVSVCPFEAIQPRSQVVDVLNAIRSGQRVIAMLAPAIWGHFKHTPEQMRGAFKKIGFFDALEVAIGAEITALKEADELHERLESGAKFMTSSCCAAYNNLVEQHMPEIKQYVSTTATPLLYMSEKLRGEYPDAILVFISPCLAKYREGYVNKDVSFVLNFSEIDAMFEALDIDVTTCEGENFSTPSAREAREFGFSGGVSGAIKAVARGKLDGVKFVPINGLDRDVIKELKSYAKSGECDKGNMIEVMCCPGGCVGGGLTICPAAQAQRQVKNYAAPAKSLADDKY